MMEFSAPQGHSRFRVALVAIHKGNSIPLLFQQLHMCTSDQLNSRCFLTTILPFREFDLILKSCRGRVRKLACSHIGKPVTGNNCHTTDMHRQTVDTRCKDNVPGYEGREMGEEKVHAIVITPKNSAHTQ